MPTETGQRKARVFLLEGHPLVREHLTGLIEAEADLTVCGEAEDAPTALALIQAQEPNLVILDMALRRSSSLDLLRALKGLRPELPVLVWSMHDEPLYAERALRAGANGYITKEEAPVNILSAIRRVLAGKQYLSGRMAARLAGRVASAASSVVGEVRV